MSSFFNSPDGQTPQGVFVLDPATGQPAAPGGAGGNGLTDAQLRAAPVPVSGPLTDAQLRASMVGVEPLGVPTVARQLTATTTSQNTALTSTCRRISIRARFADIRFAIGTGAQTANASTSHYIAVDERLDLAVPANAQIAVIRESSASVNGSLALTELS